jgi:hypothetical protein
MTLVVPDLLVTLRIIICPIVRRAAYSLRVDTPIFEATPVTLSVLGTVLTKPDLALCPQLARAGIMPESVDSGFDAA